MSITVTPQPNNVPPRVRIDIDSDNSSKSFTSLTISRDGKPIREQPYIGGSEAVIFDYEAPFGVPVTYSATGTIATYTTLHDETWASLSGWTTIALTPSVTGSHLGGGSVRRDLAFPAQGRLVSQGLASSTNFLARINFGGLRLYRNATGAFVYFGKSEHVVAGLGSPFTAVWDAVSVVLTTTSGTWVIPRGSETAGDQLSAFTQGAGVFVEDFVISTPTNAPFSATATTTLATTEAWLIHPSHPSLSVSVDPGQHKFRDVGINVDGTSKAAVTRAARSTRHDLAGRRRAVVITSGPRSAPEWELALRTRTLADRDSVVAIVDDQTPLLLRSPPGWSWDLPDDWYSVGDYSETRPRGNRLDFADRLITLPLTPVDEPIVRQGALWTWGDVMLKYATWADVLADNDTWLDVLTGPTS